jgi:hypothetical protein
MPGQNIRIKCVTHLEKNLYNIYLKVSRTKHNKPFKYRKSFDDFETNDNYIYVKKLGYFFRKFPHINIEDFFGSPYEVYPDQDMYDLRYYTTPKAIRIYGTYITQKNNESPDSQYHIKFAIDSLMYIFKFCKQNQLALNEYMDHKTNDLHTFILHIRERKVSFYTLFGFDEFSSRLKLYSANQIDFTLGKNFEKSLAQHKIRYYNSNRAKMTVSSGLAKIDKLLNKLLTK